MSFDNPTSKCTIVNEIWERENEADDVLLQHFATLDELADKCLKRSFISTQSSKKPIPVGKPDNDCEMKTDISDIERLSQEMASSLSLINEEEEDIIIDFASQNSKPIFIPSDSSDDTDSPPVKKKQIKMK